MTRGKEWAQARDNFNSALAEYWDARDTTKKSIQGARYGERRKEERNAMYLEMRALFASLFREGGEKPVAERSFLNQPSKALDGKSPMDLIEEGSMQSLREAWMYVRYHCLRAPRTKKEFEKWEKFEASFE